MFTESQPVFLGMGKCCLVSGPDRVSPETRFTNTGRGTFFWWCARSKDEINNSDHQAYKQGQTNDKEKAQWADHAVRFAG